MAESARRVAARFRTSLQGRSFNRLGRDSRFGALIRRVIPAMAASLGGFLALTGLTWAYLHDHYPVSTFWPMQLFESGWLLVACALLTAGTLWLVRRCAA